ncbi:MAG: hypothetical protein DSY89_11010 [Deltaproteobacteria bacterium]|nr:MAG: hypothetical protein DSY89_11010 [Deltaproteobacteria bacterium]
MAEFGNDNRITEEKTGAGKSHLMLAARYYLLDDHDASGRYVEKVRDGTTRTRNLKQRIQITDNWIIMPLRLAHFC